MSDGLLIGSRAAKFWFHDFRNPADDYDIFIDYEVQNKWLDYNKANYTDIIHTGDDVINVQLRFGSSIGFDNTRYKSVQLFIVANKNMPVIQLFGLNLTVASPESLLAIKRSHLHHRHNWYKHISDFVFLKSRTTIPKSLNEALSERTKERDRRGDFKTAASLSTSNEAFFARSETATRRKFVHDDLHLVVKYYDKPLYMMAKVDQSSANLDERLFNNFTFEQKCNLVREEAYAIALERIIIPQWYNQYSLSKIGVIDDIVLRKDLSEMAYKYAIMRISTDLTKGWFRDFAIENHKIIMETKTDYTQLFLDAFNDGVLKLK